MRSPASVPLSSNSADSTTGKAIDLGAGIFLDLHRQIVGLGPVFELVVIAEIDLAQAVRLRPAAAEISKPFSGVDGGPPLVPQA